MRIFLYLMIFSGGAVPLFFFALYFSSTGFYPVHIFNSLFGNSLTSGFTLDLFLSIFVFLVWTFVEFKNDLKKWLILLLASCCVGLSLSLPIYLLFKHNAKEGYSTSDY